MHLGTAEVGLLCDRKEKIFLRQLVLTVFGNQKFHDFEMVPLLCCLYFVILQCPVFFIFILFFITLPHLNKKSLCLI